jgi:anti-anti-sigma factor
MRDRGNPDAQVVAVAGRLDGATVADIRPRLHAAIDMGEGDLAIDLHRVETIDVAGLGVLVGAHRKATGEGRRLFLRNVPPRVMRVLATTRLYRVLPVEPAA